MKTILFVNSSLSGGGSEKVMTLLANKFSEFGYRVIMVLVVKNEESYALSEKVEHFYIRQFNGGIQMRLGRLAELRKCFHHYKPDYIISFMTQINIYTMIAAFGTGIPVIVSERADPRRRKLLIQIIERVLYTIKAKTIVFQTDMVQSFFSKQIQSKSVVIPNPIDASIIPQRELPIKKTIIGIGRMTEQKNFEMLIQAFSLFLNFHSDYSLHIYGDGPLRNKLQQIVVELGIVEKVKFHGYVDNILNDICNASMYVSTSNFEGISNAMLECMAVGIPSICTDCPVGGARMVIKNNENGLLTPVGDVETLVSAMRRIAEDVFFSNQISDNGKKVLKTYSIERISRIWLHAIGE